MLLLERDHDDPRDAPEPIRDRWLRRYARTRRPDDLERLVLSYLPLARSLARRYATSSCAPEDLEQAACEGLIKAIQRFDPDRGSSFAGFAVPTILGELRRFLRDTSWPAHVPRALQERVRAVRTAARDLTASNGRPPTVGDLADAVGTGSEQVVEALGVSAALNVVPLDGPSRVDEQDGPAVADRLGAEDGGYDRVECLATIERALPTLSRGERAALRLHFGEELTQRQIAGRLGVSRSEVARDLTSAVSRLRTVAAA